MKNVVCASNVATTYVRDTISDELNALGTLYRWYRFKRMKVTLYPDSGSTFNAMAFFGPNITNSVSSVGDFQSEYLAFSTAGTSTPQSFTVPGDVLCAAHKWYITEGSGGATDTEDLGQVKFYSTTAAGSLYIKFSIDYEFKLLEDSSVQNFARATLRAARAKPNQSEPSPPRAKPHVAGCRCKRCLCTVSATVTVITDDSCEE